MKSILYRPAITGIAKKSDELMGVTIRGVISVENLKHWDLQPLSRYSKVCLDYNSGITHYIHVNTIIRAENQKPREVQHTTGRIHIQDGTLTKNSDGEHVLTIKAAFILEEEEVFFDGLMHLPEEIVSVNISDDELPLTGEIDFGLPEPSLSVDTDSLTSLTTESIRRKMENQVDTDEHEIVLGGKKWKN